MKKILVSIYSVYALILFFIFLIFIFICYLPVIIFAGQNRMIYFVVINRIFLQTWAACCGIRMKLTGQEKIDKTQTYVITPNHCNMLDIPLSSQCIILNFRVLAKMELKKIPLFGQLIYMTSILVDRSNAESRAKSSRVMVNALKKGISLFIFPEGTRNRTDKPLKAFYDGAFRAAIEAQVPILPCVQLNMREIQPVETWTLYPGTVEFRVLDPIPTTGMTLSDLEMLKNLVRERITEVLMRDDKYWQKHPVTAAIAS